MALGYITSLRNTRLDALTTAVGNAGLWRIYDGTRPATGGTATTLLAELTCGTPFAAAASGGVLTLGAITQDSSANIGGVATWARIATAAGVAIIDMNVGTTGSDLNLTTTTIVATQPVSIPTQPTITEGNA